MFQRLIGLVPPPTHPDALTVGDPQLLTFIAFHLQFIDLELHTPVASCRGKSNGSQRCRCLNLRNLRMRCRMNRKLRSSAYLKIGILDSQVGPT